MERQYRMASLRIVILSRSLLILIRAAVGGSSEGRHGR